MFINFIKMIKALFGDQQSHSRLETFILAGNPQSTLDVEHLERAFEREECKRQSHYF